MTWKLLKKFETLSFSIWIYQFQKRGITQEPLCQTSHNKCHAHLIFISIMNSNFHVDALLTLISVLDWKRQRRRFVTCFRDVAVVLEQSQDFQNFTSQNAQCIKWRSLYIMHSSLYMLYMFIRSTWLVA